MTFVIITLGTTYKLTDGLIYMKYEKDAWNYTLQPIHYRFYFQGSLRAKNIMGHRRLLGTPHMFENDHDENRIHTHVEQPYMHFARASSAETVPLVYPVDNVSADEGHLYSYWNPLTRASRYSSQCHNVEIPHYHANVPGPSHDPSVHPSVAGSFSIAPVNYYTHASASSSERQICRGTDGGSVDHAMAGGRGPYKRKSPGIPAACEEGSTSRYHGAGSSSDLPVSSDLRHPKPNTNGQHFFWDPVVMGPSYGNNGLTIRSEGSSRNVRSRSGVDLESNLGRAHLSSNPLPYLHNGSHSMDHHSPIDLPSQSSITVRGNQFCAVPPAHWRALVSSGTNTSNSSTEAGGYHNSHIPMRNPVHQNLRGNSQFVRGARTSYSQRPTPAFRSPSSHLCGGYIGTSDGSLNLVGQNSVSRPSRPSAVVGWRTSERNARSRISSERYRSFSDETSSRDRFSSESLMFVDHPTVYGSRNLFDHHRDMRLDIDNMSYEELLALGERIGNVNTGLTDAVMSKCLTETVYRSSDQGQEEQRCVICLDEYKNMDDVAKLNVCGHDYHVACIRQWLSMKNTCPICKTSADPENGSI